VELAPFIYILETEVIGRLSDIMVIVKDLRNAFQTPLIDERREVFEYFKVNLKW